MFFNQDEKLNHRCYKNVLNSPRSGPIQHFTSTRLQAEKDIVQPHPTYPNKTHFTTNPEPIPTQHSYKPQTDIKMDKKYSSICSSLKDNEKVLSTVLPVAMQMDYSAAKTDKHWSIQKAYDGNTFNSGSPSPKQNSIPRQADWPVQKPFDPNTFKSINVSSTNHKQTANAFNAINPSPSHEKSSKELEPVGVFWDFENCSVPKGKSAQAVVQKIRSVFFKEKREVEFMCVCDTSKEKKSVIEELNKAQVK